MGHNGTEVNAVWWNSDGRINGRTWQTLYARPYSWQAIKIECFSGDHSWSCQILLLDHVGINWKSTEFCFFLNIVCISAFRVLHTMWLVMYIDFIWCFLERATISQHLHNGAKIFYLNMGECMQNKLFLHSTYFK